MRSIHGLFSNMKSLLICTERRGYERLPAHIQVLLLCILTAVRSLCDGLPWKLLWKHVCLVSVRCYFAELISIFSFVVPHMHNVLNEF